MNKKRLLKWLLIFVLWVCGSTICLGESLFKDLGQKKESYTVVFEGQKAMISRDGSEAVPITSGTTLSQTGHYYLSVMQNEKWTITHFNIVSQAQSSTYHIKRLSEMEELFKAAADQFESELVVYIDHTHFTNEQIDEHLAMLIEKLRQKYPMYAVNSSGSYYHILRGQSQIQLKVHFEYPLKVKANLETYQEEARTWIHQQLSTQLTTGMKDYDIENAMMQCVMKYLTYSMQEESINATSLSHTLIGAVKNKTAVCDGYSKMFMYLLNAAGVPTQMVIGAAKDGSTDVGHAWNLVKIQGDYYHVDTTFADVDEKSIGLPYYFNETDAGIQRDHIWDRSAYPKAVTQTFTGPYMPCKLKGVYRAYHLESLKTAYAQIQKEKIPGTLILQGISQNNWDEETAISGLLEAYQKTLHYKIVEAYDAMLIWFY